MSRRNAASMDAVLGELGALWKKYPDMRLGQLIANAVGRVTGGCDPFYFEDVDLVDAVRKLDESLQTQRSTE